VINSKPGKVITTIALGGKIEIASGLARQAAVTVHLPE
jgi:hypothetical protein